MSSDLVKRLRDEAAAQMDLAHDCDCPPECTSNWDAAKTLNEAAARIEALEGEIAAIARLADERQAKAEARAERLSQDCDATQGVLDKTSQLLAKHMARAKRLRVAIVTFITYADQQTNRRIGSGVGGQTMEATLRASGRTVSNWHIGQLEEALNEPVEDDKQ